MLDSIPAVLHVAPVALVTPTDLGTEDAAHVTAALSTLLADAFALYLKTKNLPLA